MKKILLLLFGLAVFVVLPAQQRLSIMTVKGPLPGACDSTKVYGLYNKYPGQVQAVPPSSLAAITEAVSKIQFLKDHPGYSGTVAVHCILNCQGVLVRCEAWGKWSKRQPELRKQVVDVFATLKKWTPGTLDGAQVDCVEDYSIYIDKGVVTVSSANIY